MVTVFVWTPQKTLSLGHASMLISRTLTESELQDMRKIAPTCPPFQNTYISWWPDGHSALGGEAHTYIQDTSAPYEDREPEHRINIYTLDEVPMETSWLRFKYHPGSRWHVFRNCATLVGHALRLGGGHFFLGDNITWTPHQVLTYSCQIAAGENVCR